jgi:hypothetical protein
MMTLPSMSYITSNTYFFAARCSHLYKGYAGGVVIA